MHSPDLGEGVASEARASRGVRAPLLAAGSWQPEAGVGRKGGGGACYTAFARITSP